MLGSATGGCCHLCGALVTSRTEARGASRKARNAVIQEPEPWEIGKSWIRLEPLQKCANVVEGYAAAVVSVMGGSTRSLPVAQLTHGVHCRTAIESLRARLPNLPHVSKENAPVVEVLGFSLAGPVPCVRPYTHTDISRDVYFTANALIKDAFTEAGFPVPETHHQVLSKAA